MTKKKKVTKGNPMKVLTTKEEIVFSSHKPKEPPVDQNLIKTTDFYPVPFETKAKDLSELISPESYAALKSDTDFVDQLLTKFANSIPLFVVASAGPGGCTIANSKASIWMPITTLPLGTQFTMR